MLPITDVAARLGLTPDLLEPYGHAIAKIRLNALERFPTRRGKLIQPSLGPVFGMKGGATGGGKASLEPIDRINLHFTGDFHAITSAHNLLAALVDTHLHFGNDLRIDPKEILWPRRGRRPSATG